MKERPSRVAAILALVVVASLCVPSWRASAAGAVTWQPQAPPSLNNAYVMDVSALGPTRAWAVGSMRSIWVFNGTSWRAQACLGGSRLMGVHALDADHVWAAGEDGTVLFYDGAAWSQPGPALGFALRDIRFFDALRGITVGAGGNIRYTDDGGQTWLDRSIAGVTTDYSCVDVDTTDPHDYVAWIGGAGGEVKVQAFDPAVGPTAAWTQRSTGQASTVNDIDVTGPSSAWVVHHDGSVKSSGDSGAGWALSYTSPDSLNAVRALDAGHVWVAGHGGRIAFKHNSSWSTQSSGVSCDIFGLAATSATRALAVGGSLPPALLSFNGAEWRSLSCPAPEDIAAVSAAGTSRAWAPCSDEGAFYQYDGSSWQSIGVADAAWSSVSARSAGDAWAAGSVVGGQACLYRWNGSTWSLRNTGAPAVDYRGVAAVDSSHAWAVGDAYTCAARNGSSWAQQVLPGAAVTLNGVCAPSSSNVWAVGDSGRILHHTSGAGWTDETPPGVTQNIYSVCASSASDVFAVGADGIVLHYQGHWESQQITSADLFGVTATGDGSALACGESGEIWRFGGGSWKRETSGTKQALRSVAELDEARAWAVGDAGTILFRDYAPPSVNSISPESAATGAISGNTVVGGSNFRQGATVQLWRAGEPPIVADAVSVTSGTRIVCSLNLHGASPGKWDVVVTNPDGKTGEDPSAFTVTQATQRRDTWYLAEGTTAWGFETYISIANPNTSGVTCEVTYYTSAGPVEGPPVYMAPQSQATVYPRDKLGNIDFSTRVKCIQGKPICADRTMIWQGAGGREAHSSVGVTAPSTTWYLPEGSSAWGFECYLLIQNPNRGPALCTVTYMSGDGGTQQFDKTIAAGSRATFDMSQDIGQKDASIVVSSDVPVIPERSMYRHGRREGHDSIGTTNPSPSYFLAEGTTAWGFTTYVLIQNPSSYLNTVTLTYMTTNGPITAQSFTMDPRSRKTVCVNDELPPVDFSTRVDGTQPLIAERSMYWDNGTGEACHDSIGVASAHTRFYLADGQCSDGWETWTLVQNPNKTAARVRIRYLPDSGGAKVVMDTIPANSRKSYNMADAGVTGRGGSMVESLDPGVKIIVERAMYRDNRGLGTDTIGAYSD